MSGFTRVPNSLIESMGGMTGAEVKVALLIARESIGWRKDSAKISVSTFERRLEMSRRTTLEALRGLRAKGIIEADGRAGTVQNYALTSAKKCTGSLESTSAENCTDPCENPHPPVQKSAPAYKEERNSSQRNLSKKTSSSREAFPAELATTTDDEPVSLKLAEAEAEPGRGWTEEAFEGFCRMLSNHRGQPLELDFAKTWLLRTSFEDALVWWMACGRKLKPKSAKGFGLYAKDFTSWSAGAKVELGYFESAALTAFKREHGLLTAEDLEADRIAAEALAEAERQAQAEQAKKERIRQEWQQRRESYATMTGEQVRDEIARLEASKRHVREYLEQQRIADALAALQCLPAYLDFLKTPTVRTLIPMATNKPTTVERVDKNSQAKRDTITRQIASYRSGIALFANYPDEVAKTERKIASLESELAALDNDSTTDGEPASIPAASHQQTIKPAISHTHRNPVRSGGTHRTPVVSIEARRASA